MCQISSICSVCVILPHAKVLASHFGASMEESEPSQASIYRQLPHCSFLHDAPYNLQYTIHCTVRTLVYTTHYTLNVHVRTR